MAKPTGWVCDRCGEAIRAAKDGWVEWFEFMGDRCGQGLRLVHHCSASPLGEEPGCQYADGEWPEDGVLHDLPLEYFLGPNGLMHLVYKLGEGRLPKDEVLEMIKRLFVPGYEHARLHLEEAAHLGLTDPENHPGYPDACDIEAVLNEYYGDQT
jgi:hypothetical protein